MQGVEPGCDAARLSASHRLYLRKVVVWQGAPIGPASELLCTAAAHRVKAETIGEHFSTPPSNKPPVVRTPIVVTSFKADHRLPHRPRNQAAIACCRVGAKTEAPAHRGRGSQRIRPQIDVPVVGRHASAPMASHTDGAAGQQQGERAGGRRDASIDRRRICAGEPHCGAADQGIGRIDDHLIGGQQAR
jgi:hypothetical protein